MKPDIDKIISKAVSAQNCSLMYQVMEQTLISSSSCGNLLSSFDQSLSAWSKVSKEGSKCTRLLSTTTEICDSISLIKNEKPIRVIDDKCTGKAMIYQVDGYIVFYHVNVGFMIQKSANAFICIMEKNSAPVNEDLTINTLTITHIIISLTLFLSDKILVHAGAISHNDKTILITGNGGAGKSTAVLRHVEAGWTFYGDDLVIIGKKNDRWFVWPYWRPVKTSKETCQIIKSLLPYYDGKDNHTKKVLQIEKIFDLDYPESAPINEIYMISDIDNSELNQLSLTDSFAKLSQTFFYYFLPSHGELMLNHILDICDSINIYSVSRLFFEKKFS